MIICEHSFNEPDNVKPMYSFREIDFYAYIPHIFIAEVPQHRLSLRKNLCTGKFEVYRFYHETLKEEVVFEGTLEKALEFGDNEVKRFWGSFGRREPDMVCQHKPPIIDRFCPNARSEAYHGV